MDFHTNSNTNTKISLINAQTIFQGRKYNEQGPSNRCHRSTWRQCHPQVIIRKLQCQGTCNSKRFKLDNLDIEIIFGDLRNQELCTKLVVDIDAVIHTANLLGPSDGISADTLFNINVNGTFNLLNATAQYADTIQRFVQISSDAVYPMGNHFIANAYTPVDELHPKTPMDYMP